MMNKEKLVIYGTGSLCEKLYHYNTRDKLFDIVGFIDDKEDALSEMYGLPIMNYQQFKNKFRPGECKLFVAIGYVKCNIYREMVVKRVTSDGYKLVNYISPNSVCWNGTIQGENIFVADNVFVGHGSKIYDGVIFYEGCTLSHDTEIDSYCFLSLRVSFGGYTRLSNNCFVGTNSTIKDNIVIGAYNIIGCGTNVIKTTTDYCVTIGNPGISKVKDTLSVEI